ncbi:MAG: hypothetical protein NVS9B10_21400 [Nevskia sp.]
MADTIAASGGSFVPAFSSARMCTGAVTSTRGAGIEASAARTSSGNTGRPPNTPWPAASGSRAAVSRPYMCCIGTVATIWAMPGAGSSRCAISSPA